MKTAFAHGAFAKPAIQKIFALLITLVVSVQLAQALPIELAMREFQARFNFDTCGNYVVWMPNKCGTPAPLYPPDGFYGNLDADPEFAAWLIGDLVLQFYGYYWPLYNIGFYDFDWNRDRPLYMPNWIKTDGNLSGNVPPDYFSGADFPWSGDGFDFSVINAENYAANFAVIKRYIESLQFTHGGAGMSPVDPDGYDHGSGSGYSAATCADAKSAAEGAFDWTDNGDDDKHPRATTQSIDYWGMDQNGQIFHNYSALTEGWRRRVSSAPSFVSGTSKIYMTVVIPTGFSGLGGTTPPVAADGNFHLFDTLATSTTETVYGQDIGNSIPHITSGCPGMTGVLEGWSAEQFYDIFAPNLDTHADPAPTCTDGTGGGPPGEGGCSSTPGAVTVLSDAPVPSLSISIGPDLYGGSAGAFYLSLDAPSSLLSDPSSLGLGVSSSVSYPLTGNLTASPVTTPNVTITCQRNSNGYTLLFTNQNLTPAQFVSSVQVVSNTPSSITVTEIVGPSGTPRNISLQYTNVDANTTYFLMNEGNGLRYVARTAVWTTPTNYTDTTTVSNGAGAIALQTADQYQVFRWGTALLQRTRGTGSLASTSTWAYYSEPDPSGSVGQLKQIVEPSGRWERYQYDSYGRLTNKVSQFGDNAITTADSANRVTVISYNDAAGVITNIEKLLNTETSRSYFTHSVDANNVEKIQDIRCQIASAPIDNAANLTNTAWLNRYDFTTGNGKAWDIVQSQSADGTMALYNYSIDAPGSRKIVTIKSGAPNSTKTDIIDGTIATLTGGTWNNLLTKSVQDITSGLTIDSDGYTYTDPLNRSHTVLHLDGTTETKNYICCGLDNETDREGVATDYSYDAAKRRVATTRLGITTTNILDAAGRVLTSVRIGSDSSQIQLNSAGYGNDGTLLTETNALGGVTSYARWTNALGETVLATTNDDGGTEFSIFLQDGSPLSVSGSAAHPVQFLYGVDTDGAYTTEIRVAGDGTTNEWVKTSTDAVGRGFKVLYAAASAPYPVALSYYNNIGQLTNQVDPDGVSTLYAFNSKGEQTYSAVDTNRNGVIANADRLTATVSDFTTDYGTVVHRTRTYVWPTIGSSSSNIISMTETSADGLRAWQTVYRDQSTPVVTREQTVYTNGFRFQTNIAPDGSFSVSTLQNGRLASASRFDSLGNLLYSVSYSYDGHGRQYAIADLRNGTTSYTFTSEGQISSVLTPPPAPGQSGLLTTNYFDRMGRVRKTTLPDNTSVTNTFDPTGAVTNKCGSREYPVAYTFDSQGRLKTMTTWTSYASGAGPATTTWNYDPYRGWLTNKAYADGRGPSYFYTAAGRLQTCLWARGVGATNSYDADGALSAVAYSDSTPGLTYAYDRRGRQTQITQGGTSVTTLAYNDANELTSKSYAGGPLDAVSITSTFDSYLRRTDLALQQSNNPIIHQSFSFDAASRLSTVSDNNGNFATYSYLAYSPLVQQIAFTNIGSRRMVTSKQFDYLNRLTSVSNFPSAIGQLAIGYSYLYNNANQRTAITNSDATFWLFTYDGLGQVTSGKKYWPDGTPVAGQQFTYNFDDIGNRQNASSGGDATGSNLRTQNYTANNLNQYTSRSVPGYVQSLGTANSNATVALWGDGNEYQKAYRHGTYFWAELLYNNSNALWIGLTNFAAIPGGTNADIVSSTKGHIFLPETAEGFNYDYDGNLTADGQWDYTWDAENRLIKMAARTGVGPQVALQFDYDWQGRRIRKQVWGNTTWSGTATNEMRFVYDGWNLIGELDSTLSSVRTYMWGLDLSDSPQGAGGVGGLLEVSQISGSQIANSFLIFDGNGNATALLDVATGNCVAHFEYGPYAERLRSSPNTVVPNASFSTKYEDHETGFLYYGYRYLNASTGRWLSRDPAEEKTSENLYAALGNSTLGRIDALGLVVICNCPEDYFSSLGLKNGRDYARMSADVPYYAAIPGARFSYSSLEAEIVWKMLQSRRSFRAKNLDAEELRNHVRARRIAVALTDSVPWSFGLDSDSPVNSEYWSRPWILQPGADASSAVNDVFALSVPYHTGCEYASMFVLLKAVLATMGSADFNSLLMSTWPGEQIGDQAIRMGVIKYHFLSERNDPAPNDWIPGDRGYIRGSGHGPEGGEWIIDIGGGQFWGFGGPGWPRKRTLLKWFEAVREWEPHKAIDSGRHYFPGTGLETSR